MPLPLVCIASRVGWLFLTPRRGQVLVGYSDGCLQTFEFAEGTEAKVVDALTIPGNPELERSQTKREVFFWVFVLLQKLLYSSICYRLFLCIFVCLSVDLTPMVSWVLYSFVYAVAVAVGVLYGLLCACLCAWVSVCSSIEGMTVVDSSRGCSLLLA